jgi:uncharacterized iron-regulated membrane protein
MKLSRDAFVRFWDVHAWIGVAGGLVLHVMFFAGGFALFQAELADWQETRPADAGTGSPGQIGALLEHALADSWQRIDRLDVWLPAENRRFVVVGWTAKADGERFDMRLDTATGALAPASSQLATILYWLHFLYHPKAGWGMYVAGVLGVAMLLAIVTGVLIHLKDLVRQFHQFRPAKGRRVLWSDMHKVLGVMGLPFQLMYALTGALLCFVSVALALFVGPVFGGDRDAASASLWGEPPKVRASDRNAPAPARLGLDAVVAKARAAVPGFQPLYIRLEALGRPEATASVWGEQAGRLFRRGDVVLRVADGALHADTVSSYPTPGAAMTRWLTGLHYAWFGGVTAKILYALLAAATCLTILTGNWVWLARREANAAATGNRLLSKLTIGIGGGVLIATAALFWANRLAPAPLRAVSEAWAFFGVWTACALLFLLRAESRVGWVGLLRVAGAAFVLVPVAGAVRRRSVGVPGVEIGLAVLGVSLLYVAAIVRRRSAGAAPPGPDRGALSSGPTLSDGKA